VLNSGRLGLTPKLDWAENNWKGKTVLFVQIIDEKGIN
jgi:hypothetical protein